RESQPNGLAFLRLFYFAYVKFFIYRNKTRLNKLPQFATVINCFY
ncbi:hypothetical protein HMPREF3203_01301, partial [Proteus mirabilis]